MKLCKATIYYFDTNSDSPTQSLFETLDSKDWVSTEIFDCDIEEVEIGEWYDEIDINYNSATKETYEKYFNRIK